MTARYRCPWCGLGYTNREKIILHFSDYHAEKLFKLVRKGGYRVIETFGPYRREIVPSTPLRTRQKPKSGVTGEGDSS